jgi:hypothetical protein
MFLNQHPNVNDSKYESPLYTSPNNITPFPPHNNNLTTQNNKSLPPTISLLPFLKVPSTKFSLPTLKNSLSHPWNSGH